MMQTTRVRARVRVRDPRPEETRARAPARACARPLSSLLLSALAVAACASTPQSRESAPANPTVLDGFEDASQWQAAPATGVQMRLSNDAGVNGGRALRVDFDFRGGGGWAAFRRELPVTLPENYELTFWLRGDAPQNTLEFKLIDATGENVWWINRPEFAFGGDWRPVTFRRRHVTFAWGPAEGGEIRDVAAIEFAITAGTGGRGTVWLDSLTLTPREPVVAYDLAPAITRSVAQYTVDFLRTREFGGIVVQWDSVRRASSYDVDLSADGSTWRPVRGVRAAAGSRDYIQLPETETRHLRLRLHDGSVDALRAVAVQDIEWGASPNAMFETMATHEPRGSLPKYFSRVQSYWTLIGVDGAGEEAMINEEGAVEVGKRAFSIEPFLFIGDTLRTWADARLSQSLHDDDLPIPSVQWALPNVRLTVTGWADGDRRHPVLWLRYRVHNTSTAALSPTLFLAIRPFQVNPTWQFLNTPGGVASIHHIRRDHDVIVDDRIVQPLTGPDGFGVATFHAGGIMRFLLEGRVPPAAEVIDGRGLASAALAYELTIAPGDSADVVVRVPMMRASQSTTDTHFPIPADTSAGFAQESLDSTAASWRRTLDRFDIALPAHAPDLGALVRSNVAWVLINRDGPAIQPGSRSYERSWIRDGSLTSAALLRVGQERVVREFIDWFAPFQYENGKVPCCVDHRGADPVPEHDSHGQLVYLIAEYFRFTGDTATAQRYWPNVRAAVAHIDSLRQLRMTDVYRQPDSAAFFGMVPQSISHEGYSAKPMHSYWDAFFVLKGLDDAVFLADVLRRTGEARTIARIRDEFRRDLHASFERAMALHRIDYLPGAVELGDFDATSTTVGITPAGRLHALEPQMRATFERYWANFERRRSGAEDWDAYTPYELRTIGSFVRLGQRARAHEALEWFMRDIRPRGWNHWAEVVSRDAAEPRFIGDMPHGWVGSDLIRSVTDMFAYWREDDEALVIGAGILPSWLGPGDSVRVAGLRTPAGTVGYTMRSVAGGAVEIAFDPGVRVPPGGIFLASPFDRALVSARVDGRDVAVSGTMLRLERWPARVGVR